MKSKIDITGVSETMLQTLYARAKETNSQNAKIKDDIAVHIVENIDYDFSKADKDSAMSSGVIARTIVLDRMVEQYLIHDIEYHGEDILVIIEGLTMYLDEKEVLKMFSIIEKSFKKVTVLVETMSPFVVKHMKEKSIDQSNAKFLWGVKNGNELQKILPEFIFEKEVSLIEGMKELHPIYHLFGWIPLVRNISNKIMVLKNRS